jgi:hypothetical protein
MERVVSRDALIGRSVAALALVVLALLLAVAGRDVLAWSGQTERANVAVARFSRDPSVWQPGTWLPGVVSRSLLGAGDDLQFGRALQRLQVLRGRGREQLFVPSAVKLARLELLFDDIARRSGRAVVRSRARQIHALVLVQQLMLQGGAGDTVALTLERAISDLQTAVQLDQTNTDAQVDLEELLALYKPIALERAGELARRSARYGNEGGGGGSPGAAQEAGGF